MQSYRCGSGVRFEFRKSSDKESRSVSGKYKGDGDEEKVVNFTDGVKFAILSSCKSEPDEQSCQVFEYGDFNGQCWNYSVAGLKQKSVGISSRAMSSYKCGSGVSFEFKV